MAGTRTSIIWIGGSLMLLAFVMLMITVCTFTLTNPLPPLMDAVCYASFWGMIPTAVLGVLVLILGLTWKRSPRSAR